MIFYKSALLIVFTALFGATPARAQQDVEKSQDHPLVTRMPGYYIEAYRVEEFAGFDPTVIGGKEVHWEGKKYSIGYARREDAAVVSMLQIVRNYQNALKKVGATILGGDERRLASELRKGGAMSGIYIECFNEGRSYEVTIVESQAMRQDVVADAAAMGKDIAATGKTIIYGIYFDTGSATIKPESQPALTEMSKLLKNNPALTAYVVGHTDNTGILQNNLKLSSDRADAVVKALVAGGIPAGRLKAAGVGPYCPIGSNSTEQGKAQNRRVELVQQ
ncbi:MAG TPA: OmpA family protein [Acidobacteriota bacterium]|nr:OmpA family protein [Acidobacteriota bacterium]